MTTSTVRIVNAVFYAHHGVMQEEHRIGGRYEVDVSMDLNFEEAAQEDNLTKTVDYDLVFRLVQEIVTTNRFYLIERLAFLISNQVLNAIPVVNTAVVTVRKPNPPVGESSSAARDSLQK